MRKKIAIIHPSMVMGGAEKILIRILDKINYNKYEVDLFIIKSECELEKYINKHVHVHIYEDLSGLKYILYQLRTTNIVHFIPSFISLIKSKYQYKCAQNRFLGTHFHCNYFPMVSEDLFDIAISFQGLDILSLYLLSKKINAKKKIIWMHGEGGDDIPPYVLEPIDKIICVSQAIKDRFISFHPEQISKVQLLYNLHHIDDIIKKSEFPAPEMSNNKLSIVTVSRISPEKGLSMIPEIAKMLIADGIDFNWYVIGDGVDREKLETAVNDYGVSDYVKLLGSRENPYPYMKNCTIYVQPSFTEGYCTTTNEARILQKPVVTTDVPGMREQFENGVNGIIVNASTPQAIYEGITLLIEHPELRQQFSDNLADVVNDNAENLRELEELLDTI